MERRYGNRWSNYKNFRFLPIFWVICGTLLNWDVNKSGKILKSKKVSHYNNSHKDKVNETKCITYR